MSLASTVPATANAGTNSYTHYPVTSSFKLNSKTKFTYNSWRLKPPSITVGCYSNTDTVETTAKTLPMANHLRPLKRRALTSDTHDLKQDVSRSKLVWIDPDMPTTPEKRVSPHFADLRLFAEILDSCEPTEDAIFEALDSVEETLNPKDASFIMNNIQSWEKAYYFFQWLNKNEDFELNSVVYNVTMKVLRRGRQWDRVEKLLKDMIGRGIKPDNITYSTVISCAKQCNLSHKAVEWYERMSETGCVPNEITNTAMIDAYSRAGNVEEALKLYERARADGWCPDVKAFATMLKMYSLAGDLDGMVYTFKEMKALGVQPNLIAYNTMFDALAKAGKQSEEAKVLLEEMTNAGVTPNEVTLTYLLKIYGKATWMKDSLKLWDRVKEERWKKDVIAYNTLLKMFTDLGHVEYAVILFDEMRHSDDCKPNKWSYTFMIYLYAKRVQVEEADKMLNEMIVAGFRPGFMVYTCLIQCYGRAKRFDDAVKTFNLFLNEGIYPDDKLCGSLLSVLTLCDKAEFDKVLKCIKKTNPELALVVNMLQEKDIALGVLEKKISHVLNKASDEVERPFCNGLIDLCYKFNFPKRAHKLLSFGIKSGVYTNLYVNSRTEWSLDLRRLSFYAAQTVFDEWISSLSKAFEIGEDMPELLGIHTGHGNHKHSSDQGLVARFESYLRELESPFEKSTERVGWFLAMRDATISWLQSRNSSTSITS